MIPKKAIFVYVSLLVALYLCIIDSCEIYKFVASENQKLEGHVITTVVHSIVNLCWNDCVWMSWCMSINVRPTNYGTVECDLNNSSKGANPGNLVSSQGFQYHEMKGVNDLYCKMNECKRKEDLGNGWFRYGKAAIKLFQELKNWTDARLFCQAHGGDLLSITSSHENDFVYDVFVKKLNLTYGEREMKFPDVYWKFNGYEPGVSFHGTSGGARYLSHHDGENALYFSGNGGYAKIDAVPFNLEGFTITMWLKHLNTTAGYPCAFEGYSSNGYLVIYIGTRSEKCIYCKVNAATPATMDKRNCGCIKNKWCHFSFIWNKTESLYGLLINGKKFENYNSTSLEIVPTDFVFGSSRKHEVNNYFHGYIKHFMLFHKSLSLHEAQTAMYWHEQGVWIGLNDQANKNAFRWSDGTPVSQFMPLPAYNPKPVLSGRKCVAMRSNRMWLDKHCLEKKPFMCEKPAA
ncbi:uncharacterized protein LOC116294204 [Actinia tenebrosa]|uniref:Uncharacterized protein LOC116294204 n=1 Tax=Actinia tenebrosa TaxID=6105 RepID=A0A6P8HMN1_ACTTE|nr:uncharacterized protein LOC116294204 [Actinia tenebrosa]